MLLFTVISTYYHYLYCYFSHFIHKETEVQRVISLTPGPMGSEWWIRDLNPDSLVQISSLNGTIYLSTDHQATSDNTAYLFMLISFHYSPVPCLPDTLAFFLTHNMLRPYLLLDLCTVGPSVWKTLFPSLLRLLALAIDLFLLSFIVIFKPSTKHCSMEQEYNSKRIRREPGSFSSCRSQSKCYLLKKASLITTPERCCGWGQENRDILKGLLPS